jgi:hypothetical protein
MIRSFIACCFLFLSASVQARAEEPILKVLGFNESGTRFAFVESGMDIRAFFKRIESSLLLNFFSDSLRLRRNIF